MPMSRNHGSVNVRGAMGAEPNPNGKAPTRTLRIAAAGDVHCRQSQRAEIDTAFASLEGNADLVLLAGDLTMHGDPDEARVLADAGRDLGLPIFAVLGNHDWHADRTDELITVLADAGITVLDRAWSICEIGGIEIGIVGTKGFVGGFPGSHLPDFGEPLLRRVYAETSAEVEALERGLHETAVCAVRVVLLHYAPTTQTLEGETQGIWTFLGTDRLAAPILEHSPDLVLHGHAHAGQLRGEIGDVPVFNVSVPVMQRDFWVFEMSGVASTATPIH
jgi:Icc-related predicted phosphoesterase